MIKKTFDTDAFIHNFGKKSYTREDLSHFWKNESKVVKDADCLAFISAREHLLDTYQTRLEIAEMQNKCFLGLKELVFSLKRTRFKHIKVWSFESLIFFTDAKEKVLLGFVISPLFVSSQTTSFK